MRTIGIDLGTTNCLAAVCRMGECADPGQQRGISDTELCERGWRSDLCRKDGKGADDRTS